jgi:hypothetical protein
VEVFCDDVSFCADWEMSSDTAESLLTSFAFFGGKTELGIAQLGMTLLEPKFRAAHVSMLGRVVEDVEWKEGAYMLALFLRCCILGCSVSD